MSIQLPTSPVPALLQDPKYLILFGLPKIGKTSILSVLPNNLILDLESGSDYISALKIKANSINDIQIISKEIKSAGCPYDFITIDTVTALEEICKPYALKLYEKSPSFSTKYEITDVKQIPNGGGYAFLREAIENVINMISKCTKNIIIVGHVKDSSMSEGMDGNVKDFDLTGKSKRVLSARSDAIGFVHRDEQSNLCINFGMNGEVLCGARPIHLANKDIIVAERQEDGTFMSHWDRVYPSLITNQN